MNLAEDLKIQREEIKRLKDQNAELIAALEGITDILHNHYGDDPDETPLIDEVFRVISKHKAQ